MLPASEMGSFCRGKYARVPLTRSLSDSTWRKALYFGCANGTNTSSSLLPYTHPSRHRSSQPAGPEARQSGTMAWDAAHWERWDLFEVTCEIWGRGTTCTCWKGNLWPSFQANPQACCAGGPRKRSEFMNYFLKVKTISRHHGIGRHTWT